MVRIFLLMLALAAPAEALPLGRVAEETAWARLTERARLRPTSVEKLSVGDSEYEVFVVTMATAAVEGQCPAEMAPRLSFYFSRAVSGPGGTVYPARLTVRCFSEEFTRQEAAVDAGFDGGIRGGTLCDPSSNKFLDLEKAKLTPAQKARLDALVAGAVARLLGNP